jgi:hypothetical protein
MAVFSNQNRKIAIKKEASFGTGGTYGNFINLTSLAGSDSDTGSVSADNAESFNGQEGATTCQLIGDAYKSANLSASGHIDPVTFPFLLVAGVGADVVTETQAGVVYKHTFTGTRTIAQTLATLAIADNRGGEAFESIGLKVNTLTIKSAGEAQPVTFDASFLGKATAKDFDFATATSGASCSALKFFTWANCSFAYNSGALAFVRDFSFQIDNRLTEYRNGASTLIEPLRQGIGGTGSMTLIFEADTWHGLQASQTLQQLVFTAQGEATIGSASKTQLVLTIPKFRVLTVKSNDSKTDLHSVTITFEAIGDEGSSGNAFTIAVQNLTASY